jgi:hypothetical protein
VSTAQWRQVDLWAQLGFTSRKGFLRTIAAMHNQMNQALATPTTLHIDSRNGVVSECKEINRLSGLGVRDDPNLELPPTTHGVASAINHLVSPGYMGPIESAGATEFSGATRAKRPNFSSILLSSATVSFTRKYHSTIARKIMNATATIPSATSKVNCGSPFIVSNPYP